MHIIFTDKEKQWMSMNIFGCPIKNGCPDDIKASIKQKKDIIDKQGTVIKRNEDE